jgi:hypothetical protein
MAYRKFLSTNIRELIFRYILIARTKLRNINKKKENIKFNEIVK